MEQLLEDKNVSIDEEDYVREEWGRLGIEAGRKIGMISVRIHKVQGQERDEMCFHVVHTTYDPVKHENTGVIEVLRQKWDSGGYSLRPESIDKKIIKSDLSQDEGYDPLIGRLS